MIRILPLALGLTATQALAEIPNVATDILPIHSLTARVMADLGTPALIVPVGASPHHHSMRPSEAQALEQADVVIWIGEELTPWMEKPLDTLAGDAVVLKLLHHSNTNTLEFRQGATFDQHDHDEDAEHGHDEHEDHGHDEHAHEDDHAEAGHDDEHHDDHDAHAHEDEHAHDGVDPHAWLDPENGKIWLGLIAEALATADPENAATYRANAAAGTAEIDAVSEKITAQLAPVSDTPFIVFHDAYHYFEERFGLAAAGSISLGDASDPSPARIAEIRETALEMQAGCVFSEPQFNSGLVATVFEGTSAKTAVLDPLGTLVPSGPRHYVETLETLGQSIAVCLN